MSELPSDNSLRGGVQPGSNESACGRKSPFDFTPQSPQLRVQRVEPRIVVPDSHRRHRVERPIDAEQGDFGGDQRVIMPALVAACRC